MPPINRLPIFRFASPTARRSYSLSPRTRSAFATGPAPPRLPEEEQKVFEELQKSSTGAFSTPRPTPAVSQPSSSTSSPNGRSAGHQQRQSIDVAAAPTSAAPPEVDARVQATGDGGELHPDVRRGAKPEFEGDRNPKTGEIGGPKNDPLRWGGDVDWSYNGRVTDF